MLTAYSTVADSDESYVIIDLIEIQRRTSTADIFLQERKMLDYKKKMQTSRVTNFKEVYALSKELGAGQFGSVYSGIHRATNMPCAIKVIRKQKPRERQVYAELNRNEIEVLEQTQHPHITRVFDLVEDEKNFYIVAELVAGGELLKKILELKSFTEQQACDVIKQLLLALNCMHK